MDLELTGLAGARTLTEEKQQEGHWVQVTTVLSGGVVPGGGVDLLSGPRSSKPGMSKNVADRAPEHTVSWHRRRQRAAGLFEAGETSHLVAALIWGLTDLRYLY